MSYPDVVIACIEHMSLEAFRAIEAALVKHDTYEGLFLVLLTDQHNC